MKLLVRNVHRDLSNNTVTGNKNCQPLQHLSVNFSKKDPLKLCIANTSTRNAFKMTPANSRNDYFNPDFHYIGYILINMLVIDNV